MFHKWPLVAVCGKFQPFHLDHFRYVTSAFDVGDHVIIGITNPDPNYIRYEEADPKRSTNEANPFTYYERYLMVLRSLVEGGYDRSSFDIVPFPLNVPESWFYYIPKNIVFLLTLYDDDKWLEVRRNKFNDMGIQTEVLWSETKKGIIGANVRQMIRNNENWEELVPSGTIKVIKEFGLESRLRL
jgi:cytidyltransferase-like protein